MVHRRLGHDDNRGVAEPLNETGLDGHGLIVRSTHRVHLSTTVGAGKVLRSSAAQSLFRPIAMFEPTTAASKIAVTNYSLLRSPLPPNAHAVTIQSLGGKMLLIRIAHLYAIGEDVLLSGDFTVSLANLVTDRDIASCVETILPGTLPLADAPVTTYTLAEGGSVTLPTVYPKPVGPTLDITLSAMQIRTFRCLLV